MHCFRDTRGKHVRSDFSSARQARYGGCGLCHGGGGVLVAGCPDSRLQIGGGSATIGANATRAISLQRLTDALQVKL
jgi:hypothetical protein